MNHSKNYTKLFKDIIVFGLGIVLAKLIQFMLMPLYTSVLTTTDYGTAELINSLSELILPIITMCLYEAVFRFTVESPQEKSKFISTSINALIIIVCVGLVLLTVVNCFANNNLLVYAFILFITYAFRTVFAFYIRGKGNSLVFSLSGGIMALVLGICSYLFLVVFNLKREGYLLAISISYIISSVYIIFAGKVYEDYRFASIYKIELRNMLEYSLPLIVHNIFYWGTTISGRYILMFFYDASVVGMYVASLKISAIINLLQQTIYSAFQLNAAQQYDSRAKEDYYSSVINMFYKIYFVFGSVILCLTSVLANFTLKKEFFVGRRYLPLIMFAAILNCISSLIGTMYSTYKVTNRTYKISFTGAMINIIVATILVPYMEIWGVCIASVICYLSQVIYKMIDIRKFSEIKFEIKEMLICLLILFIQVCLATKNEDSYEILNLIITCILVSCWGIKYGKKIVTIVFKK